jgi:hypothetical protein
MRTRYFRFLRPALLLSAALSLQGQTLTISATPPTQPQTGWLEKSDAGYVLLVGPGPSVFGWTQTSGVTAQRMTAEGAVPVSVQVREPVMRTVTCTVTCTENNIPMTNPASSSISFIPGAISASGETLSVSFNVPINVVVVQPVTYTIQVTKSVSVPLPQSSFLNKADVPPWLSSLFVAPLSADASIVGATEIIPSQSQDAGLHGLRSASACVLARAHSSFSTPTNGDDRSSPVTTSLSGFIVGITATQYHNESLVLSLIEKGARGWAAQA